MEQSKFKMLANDPGHSASVFALAVGGHGFQSRPIGSSDLLPSSLLISETLQRKKITDDWNAMLQDNVTGAFCYQWLIPKGPINYTLVL